MDPLARELACDCVAGYAQRRYDALAMVLQRRLGRPCTSLCGQNLAAYWNNEARVDLIVGKHSEVLAQARQLGRELHPLVSLTDSQGNTTLQGLFVVRAGNAAQSLQDLAGYRVVFGPQNSQEKHAAALSKLQAERVSGFATEPPETVESCTDAANLLLDLKDDDKAAAVISDYARVLLEGCHTVPAGSLRVIGKTDPVPFITVFATDEMPPELRDQVRRELLAAQQFSTLLKLLESKDGFKPVASAEPSQELRSGWLDFRGPDRQGLVASLPHSLDGMQTAWTARLQDKGLGGVAATEQWVLVTDRDRATGRDELKVFDAHTGKLEQTMRLVRPPRGKPESKLDYGESIRATPVIDGDRVFLLDAYGVLYVCPLPETENLPSELNVPGVRTESMVDRFKLATWGITSTPLFVDGMLIVNVCGADTSLLALRPEAREPVWKGPGSGTGYASCIVGTFGGRRQILGYQSTSFSGWDLATGTLLWNLRPEARGDFNVPTPVAVDSQRILLATENNGTRLYAFDEQGILQSKPVAVNEDVMPDTVTPVVVNGFAYCTSPNSLFRLDLNHGLATDWSLEDEAFTGHASLIADRTGQHLLVVTYEGQMMLQDISGSPPQLLSQRRPDGLGVRKRSILIRPSWAIDSTCAAPKALHAVDL